jgi:NAD(P)-dependent dehydrogenase (short-subunit alcohol dehydrogenase family)
VGCGGLLLDLEPDAWDRVMDVNAKGLWLTMRAAARAMTGAGVAGSIVAITSVSARLADRTMGFYCASKAAADMLVRVAAQEWAPHGIRVNAVAPGVTRTPMLGPPAMTAWTDGPASRTPLQRIGEPGDIAQAVLALHELAWVTGEVLTADGGLSLHSPIDPLGTPGTPSARPR